VWVEMSAGDAAREGLQEGDLVEVATPRATVQGRLRVTGIRDGVIFLPFHYGYWDDPGHPPRAANELTITDWDPLSKQPIFKTAAAQVRLLLRDGGTSLAPTTAASAAVTGEGEPTTGDADVEEEVVLS
jgi:anaerobic selenocysteine-containing dehydrogenase